MSKQVSNRTIRRARGREAAKAADKQNKLNSQPVAAGPASSLQDDDGDDNENLLTPELLAIIELDHPGYTEMLARNEANIARTHARFAEADSKDPAKPNPTPAQTAANRANAQHSTGPTTPAGKAAVSQNRRTHGLAGKFTLLAWENAEDLRILVESVQAEYKPQSGTEQRLADSYIQHYWLTQRALHFQEELLLKSEDLTALDNQRLALFMRYQSTHERSYYKAQRELLNLKKQKQKEEIGFESQKRQQESHEAKVRLTNARAATIEIDTAVRQAMDAPLPGASRIPFEDITKDCGEAIASLVYQNQAKSAA